MFVPPETGALIVESRQNHPKYRLTFDLNVVNIISRAEIL